MTVFLCILLVLLLDHTPARVRSWPDVAAMALYVGFCVFLAILAVHTWSMP